AGSRGARAARRAPAGEPPPRLLLPPARLRLGRDLPALRRRLPRRLRDGPRLGHRPLLPRLRRARRPRPAPAPRRGRGAAHARAELARGAPPPRGPPRALARGALGLDRARDPQPDHRREEPRAADGRGPELEGDARLREHRARGARPRRALDLAPPALRARGGARAARRAP